MFGRKAKKKRDKTVHVAIELEKCPDCNKDMYSIGDNGNWITWVCENCKGSWMSPKMV